MGLFQSFAHRCLFRTFAEFHESRRERPQAETRFDSPTTQEDLIFPLRNTACDDFGIVIMNALALIAHVPGQSIPERNFMRDRCATVAAVVHENMYRVRTRTTHGPN